MREMPQGYVKSRIRPLNHQTDAVLLVQLFSHLVPTHQSIITCPTEEHKLRDNSAVSSFWNPPQILCSGPHVSVSGACNGHNRSLSGGVTVFEKRVTAEAFRGSSWHAEPPVSLPRPAPAQTWLFKWFSRPVCHSSFDLQHHLLKTDVSARSKWIWPQCSMKVQEESVDVFASISRFAELFGCFWTFTEGADALAQNFVKMCLIKGCFL